MIAIRREALAALLPGLLVSAIVALAAAFLSDHYGAPAVLLALLLGIALHFLSEEGRCAAGIEFSARPLLRVGVALLGARISVEVLAGLGLGLIGLVILGVALTILFGVLGARVMGGSAVFGILTGGAVAICGVSAAMAIAAVLPRTARSEKSLIFTVIAVTVMGTLAMILYPILAGAIGLDANATGAFLGATIHDVAQVVGAGFSVSDTAGETATLVKLIRVSMLAPVVLVLSLLFREAAPAGAARPPLIPGFVLGFVALAAAGSLGLIPDWLGAALAHVSRWALLMAIAAVGMKTTLGAMLEIGHQAVILIVAETVFIAVFVLGGIRLLGL